MSDHKPTIQDIKDFTKRLSEERSNFMKQAMYCKKHNFLHEERVFRMKESVIKEIIFKLEYVLEGHGTGIDTNFTFDD